METKSEHCSKKGCTETKNLQDIKIQNQDLGRLCEQHYKEFQGKAIESFKALVAEQ